MSKRVKKVFKILDTIGVLCFTGGLIVACLYVIHPQIPEELIISLLVVGIFMILISAVILKSKSTLLALLDLFSFP